MRFQLVLIFDTWSFGGGGTLRLGARLSVFSGWEGTFCVVRVQSVARVAKLACAEGALRQGEICDIDGKCVDAAEDEVFKLTTQSGKLAVEVEKVCVWPLFHYRSRTVMSTCQWIALIFLGGHLPAGLC